MQYRVDVPFVLERYQPINYNLRAVCDWISGRRTPIDYDLYPDNYAKEGERFCGFYLPPFQRPEVWDTDRKIRLVESLFSRIDIGRLMYATSINNPEVDGWLIDGQQRLSAIRDFVLGKFGIFGDSIRFDMLDEIELTYPDGTCEKSAGVFFRGISLNFCSITEDNPEKLMIIYDRLNFGGVAHTETQRPVFGM